jgi:hypothetical protein
VDGRHSVAASQLPYAQALYIYSIVISSVNLKKLISNYYAFRISFPSDDLYNTKISTFSDIFVAQWPHGEVGGGGGCRGDRVEVRSLAVQGSHLCNPF